MKWHDGRSVTIEDVQFTFDYLLKWKPPLWQPFMEVIAGSERLGDRSVRVKLKSPAATFMTISMAQITLLPKHVWERVPEQVGVKLSVGVGSDTQRWYDRKRTIQIFSV